MEHNKMETELISLLSVVLGRTITSEDLRSTAPAWDSLKRIEIIFAVEEKFGIQFTQKEMAELDSFACLTAYLKEKHAK